MFYASKIQAVPLTTPQGVAAIIAGGTGTQALYGRFKALNANPLLVGKCRQ